MLAKRLEVCPLQTNKSQARLTWPHYHLVYGCGPPRLPLPHSLSFTLSHTHKQWVSFIQKSGLESVQGDQSSLHSISFRTISTRDDLWPTAAGKKRASRNSRTRSQEASTLLKKNNNWAFWREHFICFSFAQPLQSLDQKRKDYLSFELWTRVIRDVPLKTEAFLASLCSLMKIWRNIIINSWGFLLCLFTKWPVFNRVTKVTVC